MRPRTFSASSPRGIGYGKTTSSWISPSASAFEKLETRSVATAWLMRPPYPRRSELQPERRVQPARARRRELQRPASRRAADPAQVQQRRQDRGADLAGDVRAALG